MSDLLLALLAVAAPASAMSTHDTRVMIRSYGDCVVKRQPRRAAEAIIANVGSTELMRKYPQLIEGACVPNVQRGQQVKVRFEGDQYRYALADALVRTELSDRPAPNLDEVPRLDHREPAEPARVDAKGKPISEKKYQAALREYEERKAFSTLSMFGECVVRQDPASARALLLTEPESSAESAQFAAMEKPFGMCVAEGQSLSFGKLALRGTIAMNYYRLANAANGANVKAAK